MTNPRPGDLSGSIVHYGTEQQDLYYWDLEHSNASNLNKRELWLGD